MDKKICLLVALAVFSLLFSGCARQFDTALKNANETPSLGPLDFFKTSTSQPLASLESDRPPPPPEDEEIDEATQNKEVPPLPEDDEIPPLPSE
ncbi:hypothetical protein HY992_01010 [Candidatus Micrarchaeota archaeon]|nr:hypothetical protein [Candidatus Micrarchaeota archaeon]